MNTNYHTHTIRCNHANGSEEDYIKKAIEKGHEVIGFADHCPWQYESDFKGPMRMEYRELKGYVKILRELKEKYKNQIEVKIGLECEYYPRYMDKLRQLINDYEIEYIILGNHYQGSDEDGLYYGHKFKDVSILKSYVDDVIDAMETGLYAYVAHPDVVNYYNQNDSFYNQEIKRLCKVAAKLNVPLEFNLLGYSTNRHYPTSNFWKIARDEGAKVILGLDAHDLFQYDDDFNINRAYDYLNSLGIEIVSKLDI